MATRPAASTVKLDWSRLLGFDQVTGTADQPEAASRLSDPRLAKLGAKIGVKVGGMRRKNSPSACSVGIWGMTMAKDTRQPNVKLDWSRLLGFDQATGTDDQSAAAKLRDPRLAKLGAKIGQKPGLRIRRNGSLAL